MILLQQPNRWSCLITSWAMVLNVSVEDLCLLIGHDGSEILYPDIPEPQKRRSFHPAEFNRPALSSGFAVVPIELNPCWVIPDSEDVEKLEHLEGNKTNILSWMNKYDGVITGQTLKGKWHAVAWNCYQELLYDPSYSLLKLKEFKVHTFWAAVPIQ